MLAAPRAARRQTLNIRIKVDERALIDRAAALSGQTRTDFVLAAARSAAEAALLDRAVFSVNAAAYRQFLAKLDAKPRPNARLRKTMQTASPWEEVDGGNDR